MKSVQLLIKSLIGTLIFLLILFISAGRINYWQGWLYTTICIISVLLNFFALKNKEELAAERSNVKSGTKSWDKIIIGLSTVTLIITYVVAGLDAGRFQWSPGYHWGINAIGAILILFGEVIFLSAQKQNKYFSSLEFPFHWNKRDGILKVLNEPFSASIFNFIIFVHFNYLIKI